MTPRTFRAVGLGAAALAVVATSVAGAAPAIPAPALAVAGPEGATTGYVSKIVVSTVGQPVTFVNGDVSGHTVTSKATKKKVIKYGKKSFVTFVPIFDSNGVNAGMTGAVKGVEGLTAGTYDFYCALHTGMTGQLVVQSVG